MIEYIKFTDDISKNRKELAKDVVGVKCTYVGHMNHLENNPLPMFNLEKEMEPGWYWGTVEMYANGRANIYIREIGQDSAIGFLRVHPELSRRVTPDA